jgi:hypothetical protein
MLPNAVARSAALSCIALALCLLGAGDAAAARAAGDPIRLKWTEGDVAGMTPILSPDGQTIGFIEYHQHRRGDILDTVRVSRFSDGSSDEDQVEARISGDRLEGLRGRSIIRDQNGNDIVDLTIDVPAGRITGFSGLGNDRETYDQQVELPPGTYWGPLIFIVVKNFDENASDNKLVFRTVAPTPSPRVIDLELTREGETVVSRPGGRLDVVQITLRPTVHWLLDPVIQRIAPETQFFISPGAPPALARYEGPRNYTGQEIRLE